MFRNFWSIFSTKKTSIMVLLIISYNRVNWKMANLIILGIISWRKTIKKNQFKRINGIFWEIRWMKKFLKFMGWDNKGPFQRKIVWLSWGNLGKFYSVKKLIIWRARDLWEIWFVKNRTVFWRSRLNIIKWNLVRRGYRVTRKYKIISRLRMNRSLKVTLWIKYITLMLLLRKLLKR